jgi:hypothetical protein
MGSTNSIGELNDRQTPFMFDLEATDSHALQTRALTPRVSCDRFVAMKGPPVLRSKGRYADLLFADAEPSCSAETKTSTVMVAAQFGGSLHQYG